MHSFAVAAYCEVDGVCTLITEARSSCFRIICARRKIKKGQDEVSATIATGRVNKATTTKVCTFFPKSLMARAAHGPNVSTTTFSTKRLYSVSTPAASPEASSERYVPMGCSFEESFIIIPDSESISAGNKSRKLTEADAPTHEYVVRDDSTRVFDEQYVEAGEVSKETLDNSFLKIFVSSLMPFLMNTSRNRLKKWINVKSSIMHFVDT